MSEMPDKPLEREDVWAILRALFDIMLELVGIRRVLEGGNGEEEAEMTPEERAAAEAHSEATNRFLQARINYHLEMLRIERGLDRTPTAEEVMRDVEAKVARAIGAS